MKNKCLASLTKPDPRLRTMIKGEWWCGATCMAGREECEEEMPSRFEMSLWLGRRGADIKGRCTFFFDHDDRSAEIIGEFKGGDHLIIEGYRARPLISFSMLLKYDCLSGLKGKAVMLIQGDHIPMDVELVKYPGH